MSGDKRLLCSTLFPVFLFQLEQKQVVPPFKPNISGEFGLDNFDAQFTNEPIQLTPDDEWVSICTFYSSYWELTIILVIDVPFCPLQRRGEEDWPVWVWRVWVHQPTPHVSRGVCLRDRSVVCAETHPPPHKHTHTHPPTPLIWCGVPTSSHHMATRQTHLLHMHSRTLICQNQSHTLPSLTTCP